MKKKQDDTIEVLGRIYDYTLEDSMLKILFKIVLFQMLEMV